MAYKVELAINCAVKICQARARYLVFNRLNSEMGKYCTKHAVEKVRAVNRDEQQGDDANR